MKITVKIILYFLFLIVALNLVNSINNHDWLWIVLGFFATTYLGSLCGFYEDVENIRNYINKK